MMKEERGRSWAEGMSLNTVDCSFKSLQTEWLLSGQVISADIQHSTGNQSEAQSLSDVIKCLVSWVSVGVMWCRFVWTQSTDSAGEKQSVRHVGSNSLPSESPDGCMYPVYRRVGANSICSGFWCSRQSCRLQSMNFSTGNRAQRFSRSSPGALSLHFRQIRLWSARTRTDPDQCASLAVRIFTLTGWGAEWSALVLHLWESLCPNPSQI